jgi:hypothetical protein
MTRNITAQKRKTYDFINGLMTCTIIFAAIAGSFLFEEEFFH